MWACSNGRATTQHLKLSSEHLPPELANALRIIKERMMQDRLPMMKMLQAEPLQMQQYTGAAYVSLASPPRSARGTRRCAATSPPSC